MTQNKTVNLLELPLLHGKSFHCAHIAKCLVCHSCGFGHLKSDRQSSVKTQTDIKLNIVCKMLKDYGCTYSIWREYMRHKAVGYT